MIDDKVKQPVYAKDAQGLFETITDITPLATFKPKNFVDQIKIYLDNPADPAVMTLYIYSDKRDDWYEIALT